METCKIIGGEFDVDFQNLQYIKSDNGCMEDVYKYSSGRSALYYIFLDIQRRYGITTVYLPDYLCSSVVVAAEKSGMNFIFYPLNNQLEIDSDKLPMQNDEKAAIMLIRKNVQSIMLRKEGEFTIYMMSVMVCLVLML